MMAKTDIAIRLRKSADSPVVSEKELIMSDAIFIESYLEYV